MKKLILGAVIAAAPMLAVAHAAPQDGSRMMAAMFPDPNNDGVTTKDEMIAAATARFDALDTEKDGKLSPAEIAAVQGGRMLARADANNDGTITKEEMTVAAGTRFDRNDTNHDGKIDTAEKDAARERMMAMRPGGNN